MDRIIDLFQRADFRNIQDRKAWHDGVTEAHQFIAYNKRGLEDWVLGQFTAACNPSLQKPLVFADKLEPSAFQKSLASNLKGRNAPDYAVFDRELNFLNYIEITEWLDPERKRDEEYKHRPVNIRCIDDDEHLAEQAVENLSAQLHKKFCKRYPPNTWLVVNINLATTLLREQKGDKGLYETEVRIASSVVDDITSKVSGPISQVWILHPTRELDTVVHRIYPSVLRSSGRISDFSTAISSC